MRMSNDKLKVLLDEATTRGYERGLKDGREVTLKQLDIEERVADKEALKAVSELARATGQTIEAMCRAMYKGRGM